MNREQIIELSAIFCGAEHSQDDELVSRLVKDGIGEADAERLIAFLPIAFGRVVISQLGDVRFSDAYKTREPGPEFDLSAEPIYRLAQEIARASLTSRLVDREIFSAVATRSVELAAVNKALNKGAKLDGAQFRPLLLSGFNTLGKPRNFFARLLG